MAGLDAHVLFPGTAREALTFYGEVVDYAVQPHTFTEFRRADGLADAIAHGYLAGAIALSGVDMTRDEACSTNWLRSFLMSIIRSAHKFEADTSRTADFRA